MTTNDLDRICAGCGEPIVAGVQFLRVDNRFYHNNHFVCAICGEKFGNRSYFEKDGKPYCERDYELNFMTKCDACGQTINGEVMEALNGNYHPSCFKCSSCSQVLGEEYYLNDKKPLCANCHLPKCARCGGIIEGDYLKALDQVFHKNCFSCFVCSEPFPTGKYFSEDKKAYCSKHFYERKGIVCVVCKEPLTEHFIEIEDNKYHLNHFCCAFCNAQLITEASQDMTHIKKKQNKYACQSCAA